MMKSLDKISLRCNDIKRRSIYNIKTIDRCGVYLLMNNPLNKNRIDGWFIFNTVNIKRLSCIFIPYGENIKMINIAFHITAFLLRYRSSSKLRLDDLEEDDF